MTATPHDDLTPSTAPDADNPQADSLRAAETPPQTDAEEMESALRERGAPLVSDEEHEQAVRAQPTEDGPGTSLT